MYSLNPAFKNKFICITGASSGIGEALLREVVKTPCTVVVMARSVDKLNALQQELSSDGVLIHVIPMDLENSDSIDAAVEKMKSLIPQLDWLFNNGGMSQRGLAAETEFNVVRRIMEINFLGTIQLTIACNPLFSLAQKPGIVVTSSIAGLFGFPLRSAYSASKHALQGYFESCQLESDSPSITIVSPGSIKTNLALKALDAKGKFNNKKDERLEKGVLPSILAIKVMKAASKRKKKVYIGKEELLMIYFHRYLPFLFNFIAKRRIDN